MTDSLPKTLTDIAIDGYYEDYEFSKEAMPIKLITKLDKGEQIVSIKVAAKLRGVSTTTIRKAIQNGKIEKVEGVTMSSLMRLRVDRRRQVGGLVLAKMKENKDEQN